MPLRVHKIFDVTVLVLALGAVFALIYFVPITPATRGFVCNDPAISYPFKRNSITTKFILIHMQAILIFVIIITELFLSNIKDKKQVLRSLKRSLKWIMDYFFVWAMMIIPFMFVKKLTGVLRPHFLELCKPNVTDCVSGVLVTDYHCTNENLSVRKMQRIMQSFPSGHAALAVYFSVFLIFYFQKRVATKSQFFIPLLIAVLISWMFLVSASRFYDNSHHALDVIFGGVMGSIYALFTCIVMCKKFEVDQSPKQQDTEIYLENIDK